MGLQGLRRKVRCVKERRFVGGLVLQSEPQSDIFRKEIGCVWVVPYRFHCDHRMNDRNAHPSRCQTYRGLKVALRVEEHPDKRRYIFWVRRGR